MHTTDRSPGKAVYTPSPSDMKWLRTVQARLYARSWEQPDYIFRELWGLVTDPQNLRIALSRVSTNRGRRSAGVDGQTIGKLLRKYDANSWIAALRTSLRNRRYHPSPVRQLRIPKPGKPGHYRTLGIPTVTDRIVQAALKQILEPIFEADFYPCSYGFRPGRSAHGALEHARLLLQPRGNARTNPIAAGPPYQAVIEGDIKGCFDHISHHGLMERVRRRCQDTKVNRLLLATLQAGAMSDTGFVATTEGTPQGGILSPLLSNIALQDIEARYADTVWPRTRDSIPQTPSQLKQKAARARAKARREERPVFFPVRYADDCLIMVSAPAGEEQEARALALAEAEKAALGASLKQELTLELSESKTLVTPVTAPIRFLGHTLTVRLIPHQRRWVAAILIPPEKTQRLREDIKRLFKRNTIHHPLCNRLQLLNMLLRGWGSYYRHATGAHRVFCAVDDYVWHTIARWLLKKHGPQASWTKILSRYGVKSNPRQKHTEWCENGIHPYRLSRMSVRSYRLAWMKSPTFV